MGKIRYEKYKQVVKGCQDDFEAISKMLSREERENEYPYISFNLISPNKMELSIGNRKVLLQYLNDTTNYLSHFTVHEISDNENDYGKLKLTAIDSLKFTYDYNNSKHLDAAGNDIRFPEGFISKLDKHFDLI